jgi:hypothetical protein
MSILTRFSLVRALGPTRARSSANTRNNDPNFLFRINFFCSETGQAIELFERELPKLPRGPYSKSEETKNEKKIFFQK